VAAREGANGPKPPAVKLAPPKTAGSTRRP
jgi:hypothetical protein